MIHRPLPIRTIPWPRLPTEDSKHALGLYLFAIARMQDMRLRLDFHRSVSERRGEKLMPELLAGGVIPPWLRGTIPEEWPPLERYLAYLIQAYAGALRHTRLPSSDKRFVVDRQDGEDMLLLDIRRPPPFITVRF